MALIGNNNAGKAKPWTNALRRALLEEDGKWLRIIAEKVRSMAAQGNIHAIREIGDRFEGKAHQSISGPDNGPIVVSRVDDAELARWLAFEAASRAIEKASSQVSSGDLETVEKCPDTHTQTPENTVVAAPHCDSEAAQHGPITEACAVDKLEKA